jgi:hypothetical protein
MRMGPGNLERRAYPRAGRSVDRLGRQARFRQVVSDVSALSPDFKDKRSAKAAAADRVF